MYVVANRAENAKSCLQSIKTKLLQHSKIYSYMGFHSKRETQLACVSILYHSKYVAHYWDLRDFLGVLRFVVTRQTQTTNITRACALRGNNKFTFSVSGIQWF